MSRYVVGEAAGASIEGGYLDWHATVAGVALCGMVLSYPVAVLTMYKLFFLLVAGGTLLVLARQLTAGQIAPMLRGSGPFYAFVAALVFSRAVTIDPAATNVDIIILIAYTGIFYLTRLVMARYGWGGIVPLLLSVPPVAMLLTLAIWMRFGTIRPSTHAMSDVVGSFSNHAPALVELCLPFLFALAITGRRRVRVVSIISAICAIATIVLSSGRAAYGILGLVALSVPLVFERRRLTKKTLQTAGLFLAVLVLAVFMMGYDSTVGFVLSRLGSSQLLSGNVAPARGQEDFARAVMYIGGVEAIRSHYLLGVGFGGLATFIKARFGFEMISHNIIITAWGEAGLFGLISLAVLVWASLRRPARLRIRALSAGRRNDYYLATATVVAVAVAFIHAQLRPQLTNPMFLVVLAVALSISPDALRAKAVANPLQGPHADPNGCPLPHAGD